jgi:hypothetical protein
MAIAQLQLPSYQVNNTVDQAQWNTLGNLGNVYREAEAARNKQAALASLGTDPQANMATLLRSGDPALAQLGINLQQKDIDRQREAERNSVADAHWRANYAIQKAQEARAQGNYDEADKWQKEVPALIAKLTGGGATPVAPPQTASPFPAPGPSPQATVPPIPQTQTPAYIPPPQPTMPPPVPPPQATAPAPPNAFEATPRLPAELQPPPVKAEGGDTNLPEWAQSAVASPPDTSIVGRVASNLTSPNPAAAAGLNREQLGALYANPLTRPLATAFLQKQLDPGTWTYTKLDDGRLVGHNSRTNEIKDVTPPTPSGAPPASKEEREVQGWFTAGKKLGMTDEQATAYAANKGKIPGQDLRPGEENRVNKLTDETRTAQRTLDNVAQLRTLSKTAWGGPGAETASNYWSALPGFVPGVKGAVDTQDLINAAHNNVVNVARTYFPQRVTNMDVNLLRDLEGSASKSDAVRQKIYDRVDNVMSKIVEQNSADAEAIRNKSFYKPGGGAPSAAVPPTAPTTAPAAKPTLGEFMKRARDANPGTPDGELARYWKEKYGG